MKKSFLLLCGCLAIASACCNQPAKTAGINYAYMDTTARPGDDFAKYATSHWAELNPQPLEYPMWGTVTKVSDENVKALAGLIKDIADHGGLNVAYDAFQMWQKDHGKLQEDNGFTPEQRFFLSYANVWAGTNALSHDDGRSLNRPPEDQRSPRPVRLLVRRLRHPADRLPLRQTRGQGPHLVIFPSEYSFYLLSPLIKFTTTFTIVSISSVLLSAIIKVNATKALSAIRLCPSGA